MQLLFNVPPEARARGLLLSENHLSSEDFTSCLSCLPTANNCAPVVRIVYHTLTKTKRGLLSTLSASAPDGGAKKGSNNPLWIHQMENEMDRKPGSVLNDDLSRPAIADRLVPPSGHASSAVRPI